MEYKTDKNSKLSVFDFSDYRSYLRAFVAIRKRKNASWTLGSWARTLGLKATASISKVVAGSREPGLMMTEKLIEYFEFDPKEAEYFRELVRRAKMSKKTGLLDSPPNLREVASNALGIPDSVYTHESTIVINKSDLENTEKYISEFYSKLVQRFGKSSGDVICKCKIDIISIEDDGSNGNPNQNPMD